LKKFFKQLLGYLGVDGRDLAVFLLALLLAFSIWFSHNLSLNYTSVVSVPVIAESSIEGYSKMSANACDITARCRTSGYKLITKYSSRRKPVEISFSADDFTESEEGIFEISASKMEPYAKQIFGEGTSVEAFISQSAEFRFTREEYKKVPVSPLTSISFKPQFISTHEIMTDPDSALVYGDPAVLVNIDRVYTRAINLKNVSTAKHGMVRLENPPGTRVTPSEVGYSLDVARYVELEAQMPVRTFNVPVGRELQVFPSSAKISFRCIFPVSSDPRTAAVLSIDYKDFEGSVTGRCIPRLTFAPTGVIDYHIEPEVFDCIENIRK